MSVVLITGSCGLVGSESVKFFATKGFDIVGIDNNSRLKFFGKDGNINWVKNDLIKSYKRYTHKNIDIRNYNRLFNYIKKIKPEIIFHLAAQPLIPKSYQLPKYTYDVNSFGTLNLIDALTKMKFKVPKE